MIESAFSTPSFGDFSSTTPSPARLQQRIVTSGSHNGAQSRQQLLPPNALRLLEPTPAGQIAKSMEEQLFDKAVQLKVQLAQYAMHLSSEDRSRTFAELDRLLDADDWYEEDTLPSSQSFQEFVKWAIYANNYDWTSLGISDAGTLLVAWRVGKSMMTANFGGNSVVRWTVRMSDESGGSHAVGQSSLLDFTPQSAFYLREMRTKQKDK